MPGDEKRGEKAPSSERFPDPIPQGLPGGSFPLLQNGVAQVGVVVPDIDRAVEQYWGAFGIGPWHIYTYGRPLLRWMTYHGQPAEYRMRVALSYFGPMRIELIEPLEGPTVYADFVREHGYGMHHLGLLVEDLPRALAEAEAAGLAVIQAGGGHGLDGDGAFAYLDTEARYGITFELIERPRRRAAPEKIYPPGRPDEPQPAP